MDLKGAILEEEQKDDESLKIKGSVVLALAESKEEVLKILKEDIYSTSGVWDWENTKIYPVCGILLYLDYHTLLTLISSKPPLWQLLRPPELIMMPRVHTTLSI